MRDAWPRFWAASLSKTYRRRRHGWSAHVAAPTRTATRLIPAVGGRYQYDALQHPIYNFQNDLLPSFWSGPADGSGRAQGSAGRGLKDFIS